jgi:hypothetical protein
MWKIVLAEVHVVGYAVGDQGRDDFLPGGQLADLPDDAGLQDFGPVLVLSAALVVAFLQGLLDCIKDFPADDGL